MAEESPFKATSMDQLEFKFVHSGSPDIDLIRKYHATVIVPFFLPGEIEEVELWEEHMRDPPPNPLCKWFLAVALDKTNGAVAGGGVFEYYYDSGCGLVPFVGIDVPYRGISLATHILTQGKEFMVKLTQEMNISPPNALFMEILQVREEDAVAKEASGFDAATRQKIWTKIGFQPLKDFDLVHPGRLKGKRYHLAPYVGPPTKDPSTGATVFPHHPPFPVEVLLRFLKDEFTGIMLDEGSDSTEDYEAYEKQLQGQETLEVGQFWR